METYSPADIANGLRALADFVEAHPDWPSPWANPDTATVRIYRAANADDLPDILAAEPTGIEETSGSGDTLRFVWDFGGGVFLWRYVEAAAVGVEEATTKFRPRTLDELRETTAVTA